MKKSILKAMPILVIAAIIATLGFVVDGLISLQMMKAIDAVIGMNRDAFQSQIFILFGFALLLIPTNLGVAYFKGLYKRRAIVNAKRHYMDRIFKKDINKFQSENTALYLSTLTNDVSNIEMNYIDGIFEVVVNLMNFMVGIAVIAYVSPIALVAGLIIGVVGTITSVLMSKPLQKHQEQRSAFYTSYTSYIKEFLSAFHIIKSNNLNTKVRDDFYKKSEDIQEKGYQIDKIISYISATQIFLEYFMMYGLLGFSVLLAFRGNLTIGGVVLIVNNTEKIMFPLMQISEWLPKILSSKGIFNKIQVLLDDVVNHEETIAITDFENLIHFDEVSFSYDTQEVLNNVSFKLKKGEKYLIVGPSGGGKSTVLKLIRKYFNPGNGKITIDDQNIKQITKETYFHQLANIEQQVFIFEDTVKNNLCLYKNYSDEEVQVAIERAGLADFVDNHPDGLERMLFDNGKNISGGEKSRIAIARGLLQHAKIIILDEAFASLDGGIAREIEKTLLALEGVTVINVSHVVFEESKQSYDQVFMVKNKGVYALG